MYTLDICHPAPLWKIPPQKYPRPGRNKTDGFQSTRRDELFNLVHVCKTFEEHVCMCSIWVLIYSYAHVYIFVLYLHIIISSANFIRIFSDHSDKPQLPTRVGALPCKL